LNAPLPLIFIAGLTLLFPGRAQAQESGASTKASVVISDRSGDTVNDDDSAPLKAPPGDIVSAGVEYTPDQIKLTAQLSQPTDPLSDANWTSDSTFLEWALDTTTDGQPDYLAEFATEGGGMYGVVTRPTDAADAPPACQASLATYRASTGYVLGIPPACLGTPRAVTFRVTMYYDTNPGNDKAPVATDVAPDKGLAGPVAIASGTSPTATPASTPSPSGPQPSGAPTPGGGSTPTTGLPSSAEARGQATLSPGTPTAASAEPGPAAAQTSTSARSSPVGGHASAAASAQASSGKQSAPSPRVSLPASPSSDDTASPAALRGGPSQPFEERRGTVALVAILAALLAWAGLVMVLAQRRRLRTATL
jgi:hypothetical protein